MASPFLFDEMKNSETLSGKISWQTASFGAALEQAMILVP